MSNLINETTKSQCAKILTHMKSGKGITQLDALKNFGCMRLSARIYSLRQQGHSIEKVMVKRNGKSFAEYRIKGASL